MPSVKTVWAQCPTPETNYQVGFVQLERTLAESLIASGICQDPMQGEKGIDVPYSTCMGQAQPAIPKVMDSSINIADPKDAGVIVVTFNTNMLATADIHKAISIKINGTDAVVTHAEVDASAGNELAIIFTPVAKSGDIITWAYNDQHPSELLKSAKGIEANNQTYSVTLVA